MLLDESANQILLTLYAAPTAPELWPKFLGQLGAFLGARMATLITHDLQRNEHRVLGQVGDGGQESSQLYEEHYYAYDEWVSRGLRVASPGLVSLGAELWPDAEMVKGLYYNDFLKKFDIRYMSSAVTALEPALFEHLSFFRGGLQGSFDESSREAVQFFIPHIQTALFTRRKLLALETKAGDMETALDALSSALVLVDETGRCVLVNNAAQSILDQRNGLLLRNAKLVASGTGDSARLRDAIARAIAAGTGRERHSSSAVLVSRDRKKPLHIVAVPLVLKNPEAPAKAVAVVFISDPERKPVLESEVPRLLFGLSRAESRIAMSLLDGMSIAETADANLVCRETVLRSNKSFKRRGHDARKS